MGERLNSNVENYYMDIEGIYTLEGKMTLCMHESTMRQYMRQ